MSNTHSFQKIAVCLVLNLLFLFSFPLTKTYSEPDTYGPFEIRLESSQKTFNVGEELGIKIIISHTYPATLPGTFVVELHHRGLKEWEYLINVDALLPGDNEFTLKKFGVPAFNKETSSLGEWRVRVYPLRDQEKAQEISVTVSEDPKVHTDINTPQSMNITQAIQAAFELTEILKKRGHIELSGQIRQALEENSHPEDYGNLAGQLKSLDLSVYRADIKKQLLEITLVLERFSKINIDDFNIKKGDRYVVLEQTDRSGVAAMQGLSTQNFDCTLPEGMVLVVAEDKLLRSVAFDLVPDEYDRMEARLVPKDIRNTREYRSYYFPFTIDEIGVVIKKVE